MRQSKLRLAVALLGAWLGCAVTARAADPPAVRLVATGGTISNRVGGRLTAQELVALIPDVRRYATAEAEQFANVSSSEISLAQWLQLARHLNELFALRSDLGGIVVTSGTDTLEELAYFLNLTVRDARPVVVVGSMRNPSTLGYEGAANLLEGFRVAASPDAKGKGVLVVLNDEINAAREVTKTDALRLQTFQSRTTGVLGVVDSDRVVFYRASLKRHTARSEFDVSAVSELPRVDVVMVYQGASGDVVKAMADMGARGIVVASAGAGATSGSQSEGLAYAADRGVVVVTTTRTGSGRISGMRGAGPGGGRGGESSSGATPASPATGAQAPAGPSRPPRAFVGGEDLAPVKARILLMLALTRTKDPAEIQRMFLEY